MIDLHVINGNENSIVFLPESLSLFRVSKDLGKILKLYESESRNHSLATFNSNTSETNIDDDALNVFASRIKTVVSDDLNWKEMEPKTLCLLISQDCNLRCSYCFAGHGAWS